MDIILKLENSNDARRAQHLPTWHVAYSLDMAGCVCRQGGYSISAQTCAPKEAQRTIPAGHSTKCRFW